MAGKEFDINDPSTEIIYEEENENTTVSKKRTHPVALITILSLIFVCLCAVGIVVLLYRQNTSLRNSKNHLEQELKTANESLDWRNENATYTKEEMDTAVTTAVDSAKKAERQEILDYIEQNINVSTIQMLRKLFPEDLVVLYDGGYQFIDRDPSVAKNNYKEENWLVRADGRYEYYDDNGQCISHTGIDVARFQGDIDWKKVAADGIEFAMIRIGLRGYGTGKVLPDDNFEANIMGAKAAGLDVGVYFYSQAITEEEALEEAAFVLENLWGYEITMPVCLDVEWVSGDDGRANALTAEERTKIIHTFANAVQAAGYEVMIYGNMKTYLMMTNLREIQQYKMWLAYYNIPSYYPYEYYMFQYSESGKVDGIKGKVDLDVIIGDYR